MTPAYKRYLKSEPWRRIRDAILVQAEFRCEVVTNGFRCLNEASQVHHKSYLAPLGEETRDDLIAVCRDCHLDFHRLEEAVANDNQLVFPFAKKTTS